VDRDEMMRVLQALETEGVRYVLIGAAAMGVHGLVRATEDLDIVIQATADNVERLRRAFRSAYDGDPNIDEIATEDLLGDYPAVRYFPPSGDLYFDILTRLGEMADYDSVEKEVKSVSGIKVVVATPRALYRLKKNTIRPLDHEDAVALRARFRLEDDQ
jgi:acylphosphatase